MCSNYHWLVYPQPVAHAMKISLPDGTFAHVKYIVTIFLNPTLCLHDVLYIRTFHYNLLSVVKLANTSNIIFQFHPNHCFLQDLKTEQIMVVVKLLHNLYILDNSSFYSATTVSHKNSCSSSCNSVKLDADYSLWHQRLGHTSYSTLQHLAMCKNKPLPSSIFHVCPIAKQSRLPFSNSHIHTSNCFELLHVDVWGPYRVPSITGARFFLTMVDDFSRATWTFLLHHKSDTLPIFSKMVRTQFQTLVKKIRSDNGGVYQQSISISFILAWHHSST